LRSDYLPALASGGPRFAALSQAISQDIQRGRLRPGERLPGSRALAARLGLGRNTVVRAYGELTAEGWLRGVPGSGVVVREQLRGAITPSPGASALGFDLPPRAPDVRRHHPPPGCRYALQGGLPDLRLLPLGELTRAYRRALRGRGRRLVGYGDPRGEPRLRAALAGWLAETRGLPGDPARVMVTRGSQMALYLAARALIRPGDAVAVEALGYPPAWDALREAGARLIPVPVDGDGLRVDRLPGAARAVYLTPHHQYPTGALLSPARRLRLLAWAREQRAPILEDDYDHEYHYAGQPVLPLAAMDRHGVVVYLGTLSKAFAPGLRLGWVCAPAPLVERLAALRRLVDRQGDRVVEVAVAELLADGVIARHVRRTRRVYAARREALLAGLAQLPLTPRPAAGGMAVWCDSAVDPDPWAARAEAAGVFFTTARSYTLDGAARPAIRLGFACHTPEELRAALALMAASL